LTLAGSVSMAELSAAMPLSGGESVYLTRAFHPVVGFMYTWITGTLAKPAGIAAIAVVFADYLCRLNWDGPDDVPEWTRKGIAIGSVAFLAGVQCLSTKAATSVQDFFMFEKLVLIFGLCVWGLVEAADPARANNSSANLLPENAFKDTSKDVGDWAQALTNCLFASGRIIVCLQVAA
jgi:amino acid transporter